MATITISPFSRFAVTEREQTVQYIFQQENLYAIQNLIADAAEEKIKLKFDPANPHEFIQREAELQGQINILTFLQTSHEEAIRTLQSPSTQQEN